MDKSTHAQLLADVEAFLSRHDMRQTTFGKLAVGDAKLVSDLRNGRDIRLSMMDAIRAFMAAQDGTKRPKLRRETYQPAA